MDQKTFSYRGFMLDCARHFIPLEDLLRLMDGAALCGMNTMHWHLVDDQGWRLEIRKYPRLTEVGSRRGPAYFGAANENENNEGFYTQEQVRTVVAHAEKLGMNVIPEIEIPGHASAMLAAYPEHGCRRIVYTHDGQHIEEKPYTYAVGVLAGVFPNLICAGKDSAVRFLKDILDEVCELFPGPYVHIGGDEAIKQHWRRCPECQKRIRDHGLKDEKELQKWLVMEMGSYLHEKGKKTIVWNESLDGGILPDYFIVQHWLGNDADTEAFMAAGGKVISSEIGNYYVSRPWGFLDVWDVYSAHAVPDYAKAHPENLMGIETPLWSERVTNPARAEHMLFPRIKAAELKMEGAVLTQDELIEKLRETCSELEKIGIHPAPESIWISDAATRAQAKKDDDARHDAPEAQDTWRICDDLLRSESMEKLLIEIGMPRDFAVRVMDCAFHRVPEFCGDAEGFGGDGAEQMASQLCTALDNRSFGPWKGLPEKVWLDTMKCYTRFVREHIASTGSAAFDRGFWTTRQMSAKLFRIGELEYELLEENGEKRISLHIPTDACLEADKLNASVDAARDFLKTWFSDWADAPMCCGSWLLSPDLAAFLPETSRILHWQKAFDIEADEDGKDSVLQWVFGLCGAQIRELKDLNTLREDTLLQKKLKAHLLAGGSIRNGKGPLVRRFE